MSRKDLHHLGSNRSSLSRNPLLIQSEVGKVKKRCFILPPSDFTYGLETLAIGGGVAEALSCWKCHKPKGSSKKYPERDFVALNKAAIQCGLTTAQEQQNYRSTHDIRQKSDLTHSASKSPKIPDNMVFGVSTKPSLPIHDLLENRYQERWLASMREKEHQGRIKIVKHKGKVYETRASLLRRYSEPVDPLPYWKMKRWNEVPGELETFRSNKARCEAFHHHASDSTGRIGMFGQGIYQEAKS